MESTVFFGNGINLTVDGSSWDDILKRMSFGESLPDISSYTLKYEYIILPMREKQKVPLLLNGQMFTVGGKVLSTQVSMENDIVKKDLCRELKKQTVSPLYTDLAKLNVPYYITTNYETLLNDELEKLGYSRKTPSNDKMRLYARDTLIMDNKSVSLWNVHGNWNAPESIMLGMKDYCDYIAEINQYIIDGCSDEGLCWIDLFLKTDVHIIGFRLAYDETDLWYVLTHRKRLIRQAKTEVCNHIYYYVLDKYVDEGKNSLLKAMDVEVVIIPSLTSREETSMNLFDMLRKRIGERT